MRMYTTNDPTRDNNPLGYEKIDTKTSEIFQRLKHYETIERIHHNQFQAIDNEYVPLYPQSGVFEFDAFDRHYRVFFNKNQQLLHPDFHTVTHLYNGSTQSYFADRKYYNHLDCYYTARVTSAQQPDDEQQKQPQHTKTEGADSGSETHDDIENTNTDGANQTRAVFSACKGRGIRGWIHAFGETIVIRPHSFLTNIDFPTKQHRIDHRHIVYRYSDLDRSDYPHTRGQTCGHGHPKTEELIQADLERYAHNPKIIQHIHDTIITPSKRADEAESFARQHFLDHEHNNDYQTHSHSHSDHSHTTIEDTNIIANPLSEHARDLALNMRENMLRNTREEHRRRRLAGTTQRYVELTVVVDPAFLAEYPDDDDMVEHVVSIVSTLQSYYYDQAWDSSVGTITIVLTAIDRVTDWSVKDCDPYGSCVPAVCAAGTPSTGSDESCETSYADYLAKFNRYKLSFNYYDNAQLFSYYNFEDSVIGYASLPGMCIAANSGGIEQCTYDDEYNGNIVAHEMGHNFYMSHDSQGNSCSQDNFIMAAVGSPYSYRPSMFSSCSDDYFQQFVSSYASTITCLSNKPYATGFAVCGNGFVEQGESCDCGADSCKGIDACCDGSKCALFLDAACSSSDACCAECQIISAGSVCRSQSTSNDCDRGAELCNGVSSQCPADTFEVEGHACTPLGSIYEQGYCYSGSCVSIPEQCEVYGDTVSTALQMCTGGAYTPSWKTNTCSNNMRCAYPSALMSCLLVTGQYYVDGTPCTGGSCGGSGAPCNCVSNVCQNSEDTYTYLWSAGAWDVCSIDCKINANDADGIQERSIACTFQNGTAVLDSYCAEEDEPTSNRTCNDYICDFCAKLSTGLNQCQPFGDCIVSGYCDCHPGYAGDRCEIAPSLGFMGIVSETYKNASGITITERIDPCTSGVDFFDTGSQTDTQYIAGANTLTHLFVGSTIGVRWNSSGALNYLAVGLQRVDASTGLIYEDEWPAYAGSSLATDDQSCEEANTTRYDPCFQSLGCNDFTFTIPLSIIPGAYKVLVRFNNYFNVESEVLTIACSDSLCNTGGHGACSADGSACACDAGWSGDTCSDSVCADWNFGICSIENRTVSTTCSQSITSVSYNRCFDDANVCDMTAALNTEACAQPCASAHWSGNYCEVPFHACSNETYNTAGTCNAQTECSWHAAGSACVYTQCYALATEPLCTAATSVSISGSDTWHDYCHWSSADGGFCDRVACGDAAQIPQCSNGAVRRPILDQFSDNPTSICYGWYCDCTTVSNAASYFTKSTTSELNRQISANFSWATPLTAAEISNVDLFTCAQCPLDCKHGSLLDAECSQCSGCDEETYQGVQCNRLFWIASIRMSIAWDVAFVERWEVFQSIINQDLAYFLNIELEDVNIWQLKPSGSKAILYFRYIFDTDDEEATQALGGDTMFYALQELQSENATAARGFLTRFADNDFPFTWCVPTREECDPDKAVDVMFIFYMCLAASFGFEILLVIIYRIATRKKRQRAYELKVQEVRAAQLRLMEHHSKAQRVGMRDVQKKRAKHIASGKNKKRKAEEKDMKRRATLDKERQRANSKASSAQHSRNNSREDFERHRGSSVGGRGGGGPGSVAGSAGGRGGSVAGSSGVQMQNRNRGASALRPSIAASVHSQATDPSTLPPGWKIFYNHDGIPYYFNATTHETTWRHPAENENQFQPQW